MEEIISFASLVNHNKALAAEVTTFNASFQLAFFYVKIQFYRIAVKHC